MLTNAQQQEHAMNTQTVLTLTVPSLAHVELDIQVTVFTAKILMNAIPADIAMMKQHAQIYPVRTHVVVLLVTQVMERVLPMAVLK